MVETNQIENTELEKIANPLLVTSRDITQYRLETTTNGSYKYRQHQARLLLELEDELNKSEECCLTKGIHYEALFYTALATRYQPNNYFNNPKVSISTGDQDQRGIDFIISTKSNKFPIDVTVHPGNYPKKMRNYNSLSLILPQIDPDTEKRYLGYFEVNVLDNDLEDFLQKVFWLNTAILNNSHPNYTVFIKNGRTKKVEKPSTKRPFDEKLFGFGNYGCQHSIHIKKSVYQDTMNLLSIIRNTNS